MTTAIDSAERARFLQALRSVPDFRDEVRSLLLGEELLRLPERFAQFVERVDAFIIKVDAFIAAQQEFNAQVATRLDGVDDFIASQKEFNARVDDFIASQKEINASQKEFNTRVDDFIASQKEVNASQKEFNASQKEFNASQKEFNASQKEINARVAARLDSMDNRIQRITDDLGDLKGHVAGRIAREIADNIAEDFGFKMLAVLTRNDLRQMLNQHSPDDISRGDRLSFYVADLVGKVLDQDGKELYLTLEASYTADRRDTDRAVRNAEFVTRFTGLPAVPAIASRQNDHEVQELVETGAVLWHQFSPQELSPE